MRCKTQRKSKNNLEENYFFEKWNKDMLNDKTTIETKELLAPMIREVIKEEIENLKEEVAQYVAERLSEALNAATDSTR